METIADRIKSARRNTNSVGSTVSSRVVELLRPRLSPIVEQRKLDDERKRKEDQIKKSQEDAQRYADEANSVSGKVGEFIFGGGLKNLAKEVVKGAIIRPAISLAEVPLNVFSGGKKTFGQVNVPGLGNVESYQNESGRVAGEIVEGQKPLRSILKPIGESVLDVGSLGVGGQIVKQGVKQGFKQVAGKSLLEGAGYGAGYGATQALGEGQGLKESAKTIGTSTVVGGGLGLGLVGLGAIVKKLGSKAPKIEQAIEEVGEDTVAKIFDEQGAKGLEEAFALEPKTLKPGEFAPIVKEIEETTGKKLKPSEALKVKDDIERGVSKEAIINDIVEPPNPPKLTTEPVKPKVDVKTPPEVKDPLIQEARKYKSAEEFVKAQNKDIKIVSVNDKNADIELRLQDGYSDKNYLPHQRREIVLTWIKAKETGKGVGTKIVNQLKEYADATGKPLEITNVSNSKFWDKFDFFKKSAGDYRYEPNIKTKGTPDEQLRLIGGANQDIPLNKSLPENTANVKSQPLQEGVEKVAKEVPKIETPKSQTKSPIIERINKNLDEASKLNENLNTTSHKEQLIKVEKELLDNPQKVYSDAVFGGKEMSDSLKTTKLTALLENAKQKGDTKAISEIGQALAEHGRKAGQEIEMIKAMIGDDPINKALVDLAKNKLQSVASRFKKLKNVAKEGETVADTATRIVRDRTKQILKKERVLKVETARNLIRSLTC